MNPSSFLIREKPGNEDVHETSTHKAGCVSGAGGVKRQLTYFEINYDFEDKYHLEM